jgi:hypothetical protein
MTTSARLYCFAALATMLLACFGSPDDYDCVAPNGLFPADAYADLGPTVREGSASKLSGVCSPTNCNEKTPLAVGADHDITLIVPDQKGQRTMIMDDGTGVLSLSGGTGFEDYDDNSLECNGIQLAYFQGQLRPLRPGTAKVLVMNDGQLLDSYSFTVASIASVTAEQTGDGKSGGDLIKSGLVIELQADAPRKVTAIAIARSAEGKTLVLSQADVSWSSADVNIVSVEPRGGSGGPDVDAPKVELDAHAEGETAVHLTVGAKTFDIKVNVVQAPSKLDAGVSDASASSQEDAGVADAGHP